MFGRGSVTGRGRLTGRVRPRVRRLRTALAVVALAVAAGAGFAASTYAFDAASAAVGATGLRVADTTTGADTATTTDGDTATTSPTPPATLELDGLRYVVARDAVAAQLPDGTALPVDIPGVGNVQISHVTVAYDDGKRSLGVAGVATLAAFGATKDVDVLVSAVWSDDSSTAPAVALGAKAAGVDLTSLNPLWGASFGAVVFDRVLVAVSNREQTLDPAGLPAAVAGFYESTLDVGPDVVLQGDLRAEGRVGDVLHYAGWSSGRVVVTGTLAGAGAVLLGEATDEQQRELSLTATLTRADDAPAWIVARTSTLRLRLTDDGPSVSLHDDLTAAVDPMRNRFEGDGEVAPDGAVTGTLKLADGPFRAPFGLGVLTLGNVRLELSYADGALAGALLADADLSGGTSPPLVLRAALTVVDGTTTASMSVDGTVTAASLVALAGTLLGAPAVPLPDADALALTHVEYTRTLGGSEPVVSFSARATVSSFQADVLLSLHRSASNQVLPLLGLRLADAGCAPGACIRLAQLFGGTPVGALVGDLKVPALDLVVAVPGLTTLPHPTSAESDFFAPLGLSLPDVTFEQGIDVEAKLPLSLLGDRLRAVLGFAEGDSAILHGTLGAAVTLSQLGGASLSLEKLSLWARLPHQGGGALPGWLTLDESRFGLVYTKDGTVAAGVYAKGDVVVEQTRNPFDGTLLYSSAGEIAGELRPLSTFDAPFGLKALTLSNVRVVADVVTGADGATSFTGALAADATIATRTDPLHVTVQLQRDATATSVVFEVDGPATVPDVLSLAGGYLGRAAGSVPGVEGVVLDRIAFGVEKTDGETVLALRAHTTVLSVGATVLLSVHQRVGADPQTLFAVELDGEIRLPDLFRPFDLPAFVADVNLPCLHLVVPISPGTFDLTPSERATFTCSLPTELTLKAGLNLEAHLPLGWVPAELSSLLALDTSTTVDVYGTLGATATLSRLRSPTIRFDGLDLRAELPSFGGSAQLPRWLSVRAEKPELRLHWQDGLAASLVTSAHVGLGDGFDVGLEATYARSDAGSSVALRAALPAWKRPFGVSWLTLEPSTLTVDASYDPGAASPRTVTASLVSSAVVGSSRFDVTVALTTTDATSATITVSSKAALDFGNLSGLFADVGTTFTTVTATQPVLQKLRVDAITATVRVGGGSQPAPSLTAHTTLRLGSRTADAAVLVSAGRGGSRGSATSGLTIALKPQGTFAVRDFLPNAPDVSLSSTALVYSTTTGTVPSRSLDDPEFDFFKTLYGCGATSTRTDCTPFSVALSPGLRLVGTLTLPASLQRLTGIIGARSDGRLVVEGTIPVGGEGTLSLRVTLPEGDGGRGVSGALSMAIGQTGVSLEGTFAVSVARADGGSDRLSFAVAGTVGPQSLQLTGGLASGQPGGWHAFGLPWLAIKQLVLELGIATAPTPETTIGFRGSLTLGSKDVAASVLLALPPSGTVVLKGIAAQSTAGVSLSDLVALQAAIAGAANPLDTSQLPQVSLRNLYFSYAQAADDALCLKPGVRLNADLYVGAGIGKAVADAAPDPCAAPVVDQPEQRQTCTSRRGDGCFASVFAKVDETSIAAHGELGTFDLGPLHLDDTELALDLAALRQRLHLSGGLDLAPLATGDVDVDVGLKGYRVAGAVKVLGNAFRGYLIADGPLVAAGPAFAARIALDTDFAAAARSSVGTAVNTIKPVVDAFSTAYGVASGSGSLDSFATLGTVLPSLGVEVPSLVQRAGGVLADLQHEIDTFSAATGGRLKPTLTLDTFLNGVPLPSWGGVKGTWVGGYCVGKKWRGHCYGAWIPRTCLIVQQDGDCWSIPPLKAKTLGGLCAAVGIKGQCSFSGLMNGLVLPPLAKALGTVTGLSLDASKVGNSIETLASTLKGAGGNAPPVDLTCAELSGDLKELVQGKASVALATTLTLFGKTQLSAGLAWNLSGSGNATAANGWKVARQLLSPEQVTCHGVPPGGRSAKAARLTGALSPARVGEGGSVTFRGAFRRAPGGSYPAVRLDWGDGTIATIVAGPARTFARTHRYVDDPAHGTRLGAYPVSALVQDAGGRTVLRKVTVVNVPPAFTRLTASPAAAGENGLVTVRGAFADPGRRDRHRVTVDWGDGTAGTTVALARGARTFRTTHRYRDETASSYVVRAVVADDEGDTDAASVAVRIRNVAPAILRFAPVALLTGEVETVASPYPGRVDEGAAIVYRLTFADPGGVDTFSVEVNWDDASPPTAFAVPAGVRSVDVVHVFADDVSPGHPAATYAIVATLTDDRGATDTARLVERVHNVAPTTEVSEVRSGDDVVLHGTVADPGSADTQTVEVRWGDGSTSTIALASDAVEWTASHRYQSSRGTIAVTVADDDGGRSNATFVGEPAPA